MIKPNLFLKPRTFPEDLPEPPEPPDFAEDFENIAAEAEAAAPASAPAPAAAPQTMRQLAEITGITDKQLLKVAQLCEKLSINPSDAILPLLMLQIKSTSETETVPAGVKAAFAEVAEKYSKICEEKATDAATDAATSAAKSAAHDTKKQIFRVLAERDKTPSAWGDRATVFFCVVCMCFVSFFLGNAATQFSFTIKFCQLFGFYL